MEDGSDVGEPFVAVALRVEENNTVSVQMLTVEDTTDDQSSKSVLSEAGELTTFDSDQLAEILQASASDVASHQSDIDEEIESNGDISQEATNMLPGAPLMKSDTELGMLVKDVWDQYQLDRSEHCTLIQRLNAALKSVRTKKRTLLRLMMEQWYPRIKDDPAYHMLMMDFQEQLLKKTVQGKSILMTVIGIGDRSSREETTRMAHVKRRAFTKVPMPDWLTNDVRPVINNHGTEREMHPLRDMVLQIHGNDETEADCSVRWIPKGTTTISPTKATLPSVSPSVSISPTIPTLPTISVSKTEGETSPTAASSHDERPLTSSSTKTEADSSLAAPSESSEDNSVNVANSRPSETVHPSIVIQSSSVTHPKQAEEEAVNALMGMMNMGSKSDIQPTQSVPSSPMPAPEMPSRMLKTEGQPPDIKALVPAGDESMDRTSFVPEQFNPSPIRSSVEMSHQASFIAGGAAFGQSSVPRSNFVAPQLGSLQGTSTSLSGSTFAGITGGFAAFAKQNNALSTGASGSVSPFGQMGTPSGFGASSGLGAPSGLFAQTSKTVNEKLMQMRK